MKQKICLMALIDAAFKRTADNRNMSFQDVAAATQMQYEEVEHLLMKGFRWVFLSYGLHWSCPKVAFVYDVC